MNRCLPLWVATVWLLVHLIFFQGMRGTGDLPLDETGNIDLLQRIVAGQREILANATNKPAKEVPQVWCLYKEVQGYYVG